MHFKKYLFNLLLICGVFLQAQEKRKPMQEHTTPASYRAGAFIDVNTENYPQSNYEIGQLIKDVLISGSSDNCLSANISNVTISPSQSKSDTLRSWGYFNKAATNFPFDAGIILMSGKAKDAGNKPITGTLEATNGGGSDADLVVATGTTNTLYDAVSVEFDFIPYTREVTFRYLFASEEYSGTYYCSYDDAFALLLKKQGDPNYINLAVLPNDAGPVAVTNIHGANDNCQAVNEQYFAGLNTANIETNFNGRTVPLKAVANVTPGETYHFKMVISDARDYSFDSAVFLEAGSFDIGLKVVDGQGSPISSEVTTCENYNIRLNSSVTFEGVSYQWYFNGQPIEGATSSSYLAGQPGVYSLKIVLPGTECPVVSNEIRLSQIPQPTNILPEISGVICRGDYLILDAGVGNNYTYKWNTGETTQTINVGVAGEYSVSINNGICTETYTTQVLQAEIPEITDIQFNEHVLTITAKNLGAGELEYSIDGGTFWQSSNVFTEVESNVDIVVSVRVKTTTCVVSMPYYTFKMKNVITPNGDNKNDVINFTKVGRYNQFNVTIFDRYGKVLFESDSIHRIWNGRFQGKLLPTDSYWYKLSYENPASKKLEVQSGWILLKQR